MLFVQNDINPVLFSSEILRLIKTGMSIQNRVTQKVRSICSFVNPLFRKIKKIKKEGEVS